MDFETFRKLVQGQATYSAKAFLNKLAAVPDDKLTWKPCDGAGKSALEIAAHLAIANSGQAQVIAGKQVPARSMPELLAWLESEEKKFTTRQQVVEHFNKSVDALMTAYNNLTPELFASTVTAPWGETMSMAKLASIPGSHMTSHSGQLDYLHTLWGDKTFYG